MLTNFFVFDRETIACAHVYHLLGESRFGIFRRYLDTVLAHVQGSAGPVKLEVESAGVANGLAGRVPPPEGSGGG